MVIEFLIENWNRWVKSLIKIRSKWLPIKNSKLCSCALVSIPFFNFCTFSSHVRPDIRVVREYLAWTFSIKELSISILNQNIDFSSAYEWTTTSKPSYESFIWTFEFKKNFLFRIDSLYISEIMTGSHIRRFAMLSHTIIVFTIFKFIS